MHILTNTHPAPIGPSLALEPGRWVVEDNDAGQILAKAPGGTCKLRPWTCHDSLKGVSNPTRILVIRPGRFGDLMLLTPALREIKRLFPKATLAVAVLPCYRDALIGLPYVDEFVSYPVKQDTLETSIVLSLEATVAYGEDEKTKHITDIFAERLGVDPIDRKPDFFLSMDERDWAFNNYLSTQKKRVAIQARSSSAARDYPREAWSEVVRKLHLANWDVVILGSPDEIKFNGQKIAGVTNCTADKLTFRQSAAVLSTANIFLGPDSSLIHVAGALGTPALGLFSVVPWNLRTSYCPTTFVIQAKVGCEIAPCFSAFRGSDTAAFPSIGPCAKTGRCEALASISPDQVVAKLESMVR